MSENLVRDIHDEVALREDPVEASVRPPGTTQREMAAMRRDVLRKLRIAPGMSVAEIGCGIGLLGVPLAERAGRYVGLDFAPRAIQVANERLQAASNDHARALCLDVLNAPEEDLGELGHFDRVLMYAVLHYSRSENEAMRFLERAIDLLAPGGRALVGNLPLSDLLVDWAPDGRYSPSPLARLIAVGHWVISPGVARVPLTRRWKARRVVESMLKRRSSVEPFTPVTLPADYTLVLTTAAVERWLGSLEEDVEHHWLLPAPGVPLAAGRADLILARGSDR